jgi:hypothetical protein
MITVRKGCHVAGIDRDHGAEADAPGGRPRDERYCEWTAEVPAILHDPDIRFALLRPARALRYAAGTISSARRTAGVHWCQPDGRAAASAGLRLLLSVGIWIAGLGFLTAFPPHGF